MRSKYDVKIIESRRNKADQCTLRHIRAKSVCRWQLQRTVCIIFKLVDEHRVITTINSILETLEHMEYPKELKQSRREESK